MNLDKVIRPYTRFYELEGYYAFDKWDMIEHSKFNDLSLDMQDYLTRRTNTIDFSRCKNIKIKEELKYHLYRFIEIRDKSIGNMPMRIPVLDTFMDYTNNNLLDVKTILDIDYDDLVDDYLKYLHSKGYEINNRPQEKVSGDMKLKTYKYSSKYEHEIKLFYESIQDYHKAESYESEMDKDKWDVRDLPFAVGVSKSRPRYTINFTNIHQEPIREITKKFVEYRLRSGTKQATCDSDLKGINLLSQYLVKEHPSIMSLDELDRDIIEGFIRYVNISVDLADRTKSSRVGAVNTFFNYCKLNGWENAPDRTLILRSDYSHKTKTLPKYYTEEELKNLNEYIDQLPIQIARMLFVIENIGMRVSELCTLQIGCLSMNEDDEYSVTYYQQKTNSYNDVPINEVVAKCIKEAEIRSKAEYSDEASFVFSKDQDNPISVETFSYHMNKLAYDNDIKDRSGNLLRIKSHTFRGTVATKYANMGISQDIIRMMLGQSTVGSLKHYIKIHNSTLLESMEDIINIQNSMIQNIGNEQKISVAEQDECFVSLPNGSCGKPASEGICEKANACYFCRMFKASPEYLGTYKTQLIEAEKNIKIAKMNGWERIEQSNIKLVEALEGIIDSVIKEVENEA